MENIKLSPEEFKLWVSKYFAFKGNWKPTQKGIDEFGVNLRKTSQFNDVKGNSSNRDYDEIITYRSLEKDIETAKRNIEEIIAHVGPEYLIVNSHIKVRGSWTEKSVQREILEKFFTSLDKQVYDVGTNDFRQCGLGTLFNLFDNSAYKAVLEIYPDVKPWEMKITPTGFFDDKNNRVEVINAILKKTGKKLTELSQEDFNNFNVAGLIFKIYGGSPYKAALEINPELKPWEMRITPNGFYDDKINRKQVLDWVFTKTKKGLEELTVEDFISLGITGFIEYYGKSPYRIVEDFNLQIKPWEMKATPEYFYNAKENRAEAILWLYEKLGKPAVEITERDFQKSPLSGLLMHHYANSPYLALLEAGLVSQSDEKVMRNRWRGRK